MRIRKIATLAILAVAIAMPGVSLAKNKDKHGIGKGGVPALRDQIYAMIDDLQDQIDGALRRIRRLENGAEATNAELAALDARLAALESQFVDDDGDTFSEVQDDCDDTDADVSPLADEIAGNGIDDDCDHEIDEAV
jgi:hypothetical protein